MKKGVCGVDHQKLIHDIADVTFARLKDGHDGGSVYVVVMGAVQDSKEVPYEDRSKAAAEVTSVLKNRRDYRKWQSAWQRSQKKKRRDDHRRQSA